MVPLLLYPLALTVHAALAGVPPAEVFVVVHPSGPVVAPTVAELKFSVNKIGGCEVMFEDEVRFTVAPAQTDDGEAPTVTTGAETTTTVTGAVTEQPGVVNV